MKRQEFVSVIPDDAEEKVIRHGENGKKEAAVYLVDGKEIGFRVWDNDIVGMEYQVQNGVLHGYYRTWDSDGQLIEEATYIEGKEHGETVQYQNGVQIGSYIMDHGTGLDLWYNSPNVLAEEREYINGERHGYERWWSGDNQTVYIEEHYQHGIEHGIFRHWSIKHSSKLSRGYPQYYIKGQRVDKRKYIRASRNDPTLPPFREEDNLPFRKLPDSVLQNTTKSNPL
jgi:hypothetical protein